MEITEIKTEKLIPYENNPRINDNAVDTVANSIKQFGFKVPIVVDKDNVIVAGHTRYKAAKSLGIEELPCVIADDLTDEQIKAFRLADNKTAEIAEWDFNALDGELYDIADIDMTDFGFEFEDITSDSFDDSFSLPNGEKPKICSMTFTLHEEQKQLIEYAMNMVEDSITETFGNTNKNGNELYEVVRQWAEQRK